MKIYCTCGNLIPDTTDGLRYKGRIISDLQWDDLWVAIDEAIEVPGTTARERANTCMQLRQQFRFNLVWECTDCGKLFVDGPGKSLVPYLPETGGYRGVLDFKR